jgi:cytochrome c biogenesis protein CcmG, thiol:disulfide interchange protein DsbE
MKMTAPRRPITHRRPAWSRSPHWSEIRHREWAPEVEKSALVGNSTSRGASSGRKVRTGRKFGYGRRGWLAAVVMVLLSTVLAGCGGSPAVPKSSTPMGPPTEAAPSPESTADLAAMKKTARIAECPASDPKVAAVSSGLPDVVLPCLGGGRAVRLAGLRGKPMMINVWAQWCGPCREEAPYLTEVATTNKSDLRIIGIDHDDPRPELAIEFAQLSTWRYPQLADPDVVLRAALQISGPPQTFFVRPDGTIAFRHAGQFHSAAEIRELARQHLGVTP